MHRIHLFLLNTLILSFIMTASAIECYNCESVSEPNCGEDFSTEEYFKIDCDQVAPPRYLNHDLESFNATACMKKIYKEYKFSNTYAAVILATLMIQTKNWLSHGSIYDGLSRCSVFRL
ncbi:hypothetical protein DOY81_006384 [Sarcophaga bullata]|nr:hypothetical protein DOY81_006384 [Sarcophaga bullata]